MQIGKHIIRIAIFFFLIQFLGVIGYMTIEGWTFLEALFMTIITVSTVGYDHLHPLSTTGQVFTIGIIVMGVGGFVYIASVLAEYIVAGHLHGDLERRKMKNRIEALQDHYIICGFGKVGGEVARELEAEGVQFVVVDSDPVAIEKCLVNNYTYIKGNAVEDDILKLAGIMKARGLVSATNSDTDNVYVTLSARSLNSDLVIVARATNDEVERKLLRAGADRVISPYRLGGHRLASLLIRPAVVEFMDIVTAGADIELIMEEVIVHERSGFVGKSVAEARSRSTTGANILAVKKVGDLRITAHPSPETIINSGDRLVALGTRPQLKTLEELA